VLGKIKVYTSSQRPPKNDFRGGIAILGQLTMRVTVVHSHLVDHAQRVIPADAWRGTT